MRCLYDTIPVSDFFLSPKNRRTEETSLITDTFSSFTEEKQLTSAIRNNYVFLWQCSLQAFPLRPQHSGIEIPHWQPGEMERLIFSKTYISSTPTLIRIKPLITVLSKTTVKYFPSYLLPRVQGLLRQLVLVPGSDATHLICPSSDPQLAALSVPPLLSDLPVIGREGDGHLTSDGNLQTQDI